MTAPDPAMADNLTALVEREYRKTATIKAVQWFKIGDHPAVKPIGEAIGGANPGQGWVETLEGRHIVTPGDWIATGVKGEHWPIKPDVFAATYEPLDALEASQPKEDAAGGGEAADAQFERFEQQQPMTDAVEGIPAGMVALKSLHLAVNKYLYGDALSMNTRFVALERAAKVAGQVIAYTPKARPTASDGEARERIARIVDPDAWKRRDDKLADADRWHQRASGYRPSERGKELAETMHGLCAGDAQTIIAKSLAKADAILAALPTTDGAKGETETANVDEKLCLTCEGSGHMTFYGRFGSSSSRCPACDGRGRVRPRPAEIFDPAGFGLTVLSTMAQRKLSCRKAAPEIGISPATLNRISRGEMPDLPSYLKLVWWMNDSATPPTTDAAGMWETESLAAWRDLHGASATTDRAFTAGFRAAIATPPTTDASERMREAIKDVAVHAEAMRLKWQEIAAGEGVTVNGTLIKPDEAQVATGVLDWVCNALIAALAPSNPEVSDDK